MRYEWQSPLKLSKDAGYFYGGANILKGEGGLGGEQKPLPGQCSRTARAVAASRVALCARRAHLPGRAWAACRGSYLLSLAAGAWIYLVEPAEIIRAKIAELVADGVIAGAALSLFRRKLLLLLFQQVPIKLVIFTHRNQQWAATNNKPQNGIKMGTHRAFRHQLPQILGRTWRSLERRLRGRAG